jgi:hypothetical protein
VEPRRALVPAVIVVALAIGAGGWAWSRLGHAGPAGPIQVGGPAGRPRYEVHLEPAGPHTARVLMDGDPVGTLTVAERGAIQGDALVRLPGRAGRLIAYRVEVTRDPAVDPALAMAVQRVLFMGGATSAVVVDPGAATGE